MSRALLALLVAVVASACGGAATPTAPTPTTAPTQATGLSIATFGVTGQLSAGRFVYWCRIVVTAESSGIVVNRIDFRYPESAQNAGFSLTHVTMSHTVPPGRSFTFENELISTVAVSQLSITVSYTDGAGQPGQRSASAIVAPLVPGDPSPTLRIDDFSVSGFMEGTAYAYWPRLTLTAGAGTGAVTVTRLLFELAGAGSPPPSRTTFRIPAGATLQLFHGQSYGEPEFYLTSEARADQVTVLISYVDDRGRSADVRAVATVTR